jgi:hypothetical protein
MKKSLSAKRPERASLKNFAELTEPVRTRIFAAVWSAWCA